MTQGGKNNRGSRIVFHDKKSEDQDPLVQKISTSGTAVVGNTEHENGPTSASGPYYLGRRSCESQCLPEEGAGDAVEGEGETTEVSRGTCWYHRGVSFLLTYTSHEWRLEGRST